MLCSETELACLLHTMTIFIFCTLLPDAMKQDSWRLILVHLVKKFLRCMKPEVSTPHPQELATGSCHEPGEFIPDVRSLCRWNLFHFGLPVVSRFLSYSLRKGGRMPVNAQEILAPIDRSYCHKQTGTWVNHFLILIPDVHLSLQKV